jgi:hypothetical protein
VNRKSLLDLELFFPPNIVWTLVPAVASTLENAVPALRPIETPKLAHKTLTTVNMLQTSAFTLRKCAKVAACIGEGNEAVCINAWKNVEDFEKGQEAAWKDKSFPLEKVASTVITYNDKILKPVAFFPLK